MQPVTQKIDGKRVWLRDDDGKQIYKESGEDRKVGDVWTIPIINPMSDERLGYPTQSLKRSWQILSTASDGVTSFSIASWAPGTTQAVAMSMGRRFIGADINLGAIETTIKRLSAQSVQLASALTPSNGQQASPMHAGNPVCCCADEGERL